MRLVTTELGQALQLFIADELQSPRGLYVPDVRQSVAQRYRFAKVPPPPPAGTATQDLKFESGIITLPGGNIPIQNLEIYNDGIIVNVRNTTDADAVMDDFFEWTSKTFDLRPPQTPIRRQYTSHVVVDFDHSISGLLKDFDRMCRLVETAYKAENDQFDYPLHLSQFALSADPKELPPFVHTSFVIEPRGNYPYAANRYFSNAPVTTERHLELLEEIEATLSD